MGALDAYGTFVDTIHGALHVNDKHCSFAYYMAVDVHMVPIRQQQTTTFVGVEGDKHVFSRCILFREENGIRGYAAIRVHNKISELLDKDFYINCTSLLPKKSIL